MSAAWTSPDTWVDPTCIECGGAGAPCCDPPDHPYPTDPITLVYVEAVKAMAEQRVRVLDHLDRQGAGRAVEQQMLRTAAADLADAVAARAAVLAHLDTADSGGNLDPAWIRDLLGATDD